MLTNKNIICISSIDWDFIWQGHQEIMSTFAKNGNKVLYIENMGVRSPNLSDMPRLKSRIKNWFKGTKGIRKVEEGLYVFAPLVFPFPYSRFFRFLNRMILGPTIKTWMKLFNFESPIIWVFLPTSIALDLVHSLNGEAVIYYCVDRFAYSSQLAKKIKQSERQLIEEADLVFASTKNLAEECGRYRKDVETFYFGVNTANFEKVRDSNSLLPEDLNGIKHPIAGYMGGIHKWIDFDLLKYCAENLPDYSFVFVGPVQVDVSMLRDLKNVHFLGQKSYADIPRYIKEFDVGIIPYLVSDYTIVGRPTKLTEYFIMGKPVVSTALPEVALFNKEFDGIVLTGGTKEEFRSGIEKSSVLDDQERRQARMRLAEANSWDKKVEGMSTLIYEVIDRKRAASENGWKERLRTMPHVLARRITQCAVVVLAVYMLLFHTPFVWWLGSPLKFESPLKKADVIVVFAGGVGESGRAGQGYEERVKSAVDFYRRGYARTIIFSSGYSYAFKEADVMKALALSLGIPESSIILEDKAVNTYENVVNTSRIMDKEGLRSAIVISAPYNMRRIDLVWRKIAGDKEMIAEPVRGSLFFGGMKRVEWKHVQAIVHEYLGILYYKLKGYI